VETDDVDTCIYVEDSNKLNYAAAEESIKLKIAHKSEMIEFYKE